MTNPQHQIKRSHLFERMLPLFLVIITAIVVVFQAQVLVQVREELAALRTSLTKLESPAAVESSSRFEPFAVLEQRCTDCHSERRYTGLHGTSSGVSEVLNYMESKSTTKISQHDLGRIHDSIVLLKCISCHDEGKLKVFAGMSGDKRYETIERMRQMPSAAISEGDSREIERAIHNLQGF